MKKKRGKIFIESVLKNKKAMELEELGGWLIALAIAVIVGIGYAFLREDLSGGIEFIKNLFRFRG